MAADGAQTQKYAWHTSLLADTAHGHRRSDFTVASQAETQRHHGCGSGSVQHQRIQNMTFIVNKLAGKPGSGPVHSWNEQIRFRLVCAFAAQNKSEIYNGK